MRTLLGRLFDFQKYEDNEKLRKIIADTEERYDSALSDDDLEMVNAAGVNQMTTVFQNLDIHEKAKGQKND